MEPKEAESISENLPTVESLPTANETTPTRKRKIGPYEDLVNFTVCVPYKYVYELDSEEFDDIDVQHKLYAFQGYKGETLEDVFTKETLAWMNIHGKYDILFKSNGGYGKQTHMCGNFDLHYLVQHYSTTEGKCVITLKPEKEMWYKCLRLTEEEIVSAKQIINDVDKRMFKRFKKS